MIMPCPLCRSDRTRQYFSDNTITLLKCESCGLKFQHPMPTPVQLNEIYSLNYYDSFYPKKILGEQKLLFLRRLEKLEALSGGKRGRVLDVGSGRGMFLEAALERGWSCVGQEFSMDAAEAIQKRLGIEVVVCRELNKAGFEAESFDLVNMNHVLEHLYEPELAVREIHRILKPGGLFYCEVPRQGNFLNNLSNIFGKRDFGFSYLPEHLFLFDKRSLSMLLNKSGFDVLSAKIEGLGDAHRFVRGVHYTSFWTRIIVMIVGGLRLQTPLGGGNLAVTSRKVMQDMEEPG